LKRTSGCQWGVDTSRVGRGALVVRHGGEWKKKDRLVSTRLWSGFLEGGPEKKVTTWKMPNLLQEEGGIAGVGGSRETSNKRHFRGRVGEWVGDEYTNKNQEEEENGNTQSREGAKRQLKAHKLCCRLAFTKRDKNRKSGGKKTRRRQGKREGWALQTTKRIKKRQGRKETPETSTGLWIRGPRKVWKIEDKVNCNQKHGIVKTKG